MMFNLSNYINLFIEGYNLANNNEIAKFNNLLLPDEFSCALTEGFVACSFAKD